MDDDDPLPMNLAELQAMLEKGLEDIRAGRTVPLGDVLAELDQAILEMKQASQFFEANPAT